MTESEEFAEALLDQLSVEFNEEKNIEELNSKIDEDSNFSIKFDDLKDISYSIFPNLKQKVEEYTGISVTDSLKIEFPDLLDFKILKGKKVFTTDDARSYVDNLFLAVSTKDKQKITEFVEQDTAKYLVYSTYAKNYLSKISTTYGDILDDVIYLNKFILSSYPKIILYKFGSAYFESKLESVKSGYVGALKMTILEEIVHSTQKNLYRKNYDAVIQINSINEELAKIILDLDDKRTIKLYDYLQLQTVPNDFPMAKRANLFFFLNPDFFLVEQIGPDIMTYTNVEIDPKISETIPQLLGLYKKWLEFIQIHHAIFTTMEGMADFIVQNILVDDSDFQNYLSTFIGTNPSSYGIRKNMGKEFTSVIYDKLKKSAFITLNENHPTTKELKNPQEYINRITVN